MTVQRCYVTPPTAAEKAKASQDEPVTAVDDSALQDGSVPERTKPTPGGNFTTGDEGRDNDAEVSPISPFLQLAPQHNVSILRI